MISDHRRPDSPSRPFNDFYRNKRVLVTGHTGFKGSWLTLWLLELGARVAGFSSYLPSRPCNYEVLGLRDKVFDCTDDIRDLGALKKAFDQFQPEIVYHLAAQPIVRKSYDNPKVTFDTNFGGTVNILECIRITNSVEAAVIITSDKCYKNMEWVWGYREDDQLGGNDPYSASKGCAEIAINSYWQSFFERGKRLKVASTRAGNVIGGGDWAEDRIIPDCVRAWSECEKVIIRNPQATRPWQHVLEPLSGYLWLGALLGTHQELSGEAFNLGPKADVIQPVSSLITTFQKYWEQAQWDVKSEDLSKKESSTLKLCCDKALALLNWQAILSFEETVEFTASWYRKFYAGQDNMLEFSKQQIVKYCRLAAERSMDWVEE